MSTECPFCKQPIPETPTLDIDREDVVTDYLNTYGEKADLPFGGRHNGLASLALSFSQGDTFVVPGLGRVSVVQEGREGDNCWRVFEILGRFYRLDGTYDSYEGTDWNGWTYRVTPKQETRTIYSQSKEND